MQNQKTIIKNLIPTKLWKKFRTSRILKQHQKVATFWEPIINSYFDGNIEKYKLNPKKEPSSQKIIWQYWGQGIEAEKLPEIIRICFDSVDRHKGDYQVIRLTDDTIADYIELPEFVWKKKNNNPKFTKTFFSDLLRVALLSTYGGLWLDATILLTGPIPSKYEKYDFFIFQRSNDEKHKQYWENVYAYYFSWHPRFKVRMLSSIMFSHKKNVIATSLLDLMLYFWNTQTDILDYFCFQILYNELVNGRLSAYNCPIENDCIPHLMQTKINGRYEQLSFNQILELSNIHKMAYFDKYGLAKLKQILENEY